MICNHGVFPVSAPLLVPKNQTSSMKLCWPSPLEVKCCKLTTASSEIFSHFLCRHAARLDLAASRSGKSYFKVSMAGFLAALRSEGAVEVKVAAKLFGTIC